MTARWMGVFFGVAALAGCGGPPSSAVGFALLDARAREAGWELRGESWGSGAVLPVLGDVGDTLTLVSPDARRSFALQAGKVALIQGEQARIEWLSLGAEIAEDGLELEGTRSAGDALSRQLDAQLQGLERQLRLAGAELWARAAFMAPPEGLVQVGPVRAGAAPLMLAAPSAGLAALPKGAADRVDREALLRDSAFDLVPLVGFYTDCSGASLVLDAAGGYRRREGDQEEAGTYMLQDGALVLVPTHADSASRQLAVERDGALFDGSTRVRPVSIQ